MVGPVLRASCPWHTHLLGRSYAFSCPCSSTTCVSYRLASWSVLPFPLCGKELVFCDEWRTWVEGYAECGPQDEVRTFVLQISDGCECYHLLCLSLLSAFPFRYLCKTCCGKWSSRFQGVVLIMCVMSSWPVCIKFGRRVFFEWYVLRQR